MKLRWFAFWLYYLRAVVQNRITKIRRGMLKFRLNAQCNGCRSAKKPVRLWGVSPQLITAIIAIESGGNPNAVSKSNAIGLMQLKASTSGRDVYRRMGWSGEPSTSELKNPERNISMGAAYLSILETGPLAGIKDPQVMQYALVVSYANGAGALLRTFSSDRKKPLIR